MGGDENELMLFDGSTLTVAVFGNTEGAVWSNLSSFVDESR